MPLVRYEIRNEYSLANPELYRAAAKDEPEGLLEGVAMAGLVGIVRQLGDLAEFAAEVFHELHEEVMATATRGHELLIRIQQLEAELPAVENFVFSETNQLDFAYTSGADWHASIRNDQNHLTRGDLPWFIRNSYEECRGPPRLFLLDKFDIAGAGACLKRYTDPSFFKMEWASSELSKAEKEQQDRKARRIKKKGRRRRNGEINDANHVSQMHPRVRYSSLNVENVMGASGTHIHNLNTEIQPRMANDVMHKAAVNDHLKAASSKATLAYNVVNLQSTGECNVEIGTNNVSKADTGECNGEIGTNNVDSGALKISALDIEAEVLLDKFVKADYKPVLKEDEQVSSEQKPVSEVCDDVASEAEHFVDALTTMESEVETDTESKVKLDGMPHDETFDAEKDLISIRPVSGNLEPFTRTQSAWSPSSPAKSETSSPPLDEDDVSSIDENNVTTDTDKKDLSPPFDENCASPTSEDHLEGGCIGYHVTGTPPHSETSDQDDTQLEDLSGSFHFLPEPAIPLVNGDNNGKSGNLGSLLSHMRAKSNEILNETSSGLTEERSGSDEPENGQSKTPEEFSPHSLAESTIVEPLRVAIECSKIQEDSGDNDDEDDGMDGMQVSSNSSLSSPSMISTPRLSLLATSELHTVSEDEAKSPLSSKSSLESSPRSPIFSAIHSPLSPVNLSPVLSSSSERQMQSLHSELLEPCSPTLGPTFAMSELEVLPPPPPLPPLEWRIMRPRRSSSPSTASTAMEAPLPPAPPIPPIRPEKLLRNFAAPVPPIIVEMVLQDLVPPPIRAEKILQDPVPPISPIRPEKPVQDPILPIPPIVPEKVLQDPAPSIPRPEKVIQDPVPPVPPLRPEKAIHDPVPLVVPSKLERRDSLIEAIASHDKSMLKKVTEQNQSYRSKPVDDREVLLEQIRTRSFSLRRTVVEKPEAPRPLTNINVAAILEKANAIRQAFAGSDEDEDYDDNWSDT